MPAKIKDPISHFWGCADRSKGPDACWNWKLFKNKKGYGKIKISGQMCYAHRKAAEISGLKIAEGMVVCHTCDNPSCVNPAHLFVGTYSDNMQDCKRKGRLSPPPKWARPPKSKLSEKQIYEIRQSTETYAQIAARYQISEATVWRVRSRSSWGNI